MNQIIVTYEHRHGNDTFTVLSDVAADQLAHFWQQIADQGDVSLAADFAATFLGLDDFELDREEFLSFAEHEPSGRTVTREECERWLSEKENELTDSLMNEVREGNDGHEDLNHE
jgi:hypothetical protein